MQSLHVLIVEDNPADEALIRAIIESTGISVRTTRVSSVDEAEDSLAMRKYALVLADVSLVGFRNGFDLWRHCQSEHPALPFVITSGIESGEWNKLSTPGEIAPLHFRKPYRAREIRQTLRSLLGR